MPALQHRYVLALGSNHMRGPLLLQRAQSALVATGMRIEAAARPLRTRPVGPARRQFLNSALVVSADCNPQELLILIKKIERFLGRRPGRRWGDRPIDIDILFWDGGCLESRTLTIPHPAWQDRTFVTDALLALPPAAFDRQAWQAVRRAAFRHRRATVVDPARAPA